MSRVARHLGFALLLLAGLSVVAFGSFEFVVMRPFLAEARTVLASASPAELHPPESLQRVIHATYGESMPMHAVRALHLRMLSTEGGTPKRSVFVEFAVGKVLPVHLSQPELTAVFLALAPMGSGMRGFEAASQSYLHVPLAEVSIAQAATLASITHAPSYYLRSPERLAARAQSILLRVQQQ